MSRAVQNAITGLVVLQMMLQDFRLPEGMTDTL